MDKQKIIWTEPLGLFRGGGGRSQSFEHLLLRNGWKILPTLDGQQYEEKKEKTFGMDSVNKACT